MEKLFISTTVRYQLSFVLLNQSTAQWRYTDTLIHTPAQHPLRHSSFLSTHPRSMHPHRHLEVEHHFQPEKLCSSHGVWERYTRDIHSTSASIVLYNSESRVNCIHPHIRTTLESWVPFPSIVQDYGSGLSASVLLMIKCNVLDISSRRTLVYYARRKFVVGRLPLSDLNVALLQ
ncbi:hypothetical protein BDP27DRAFT_1342084 [Rhodocollybia butyracea]|uniref:Uncharacterized protein n=1 Tax=Rhodocollybia butyracea TaxID=206335 RepID=A0A9P5P986_9AGAR|nr:hypothetical protein BDP27DRAFT_1342084 [Rhodocollybia butyracea]